MSGFRVAIDIGGTFTDVVLIDDVERPTLDRQGPVDAERSRPRASSGRSTWRSTRQASTSPTAGRSSTRRPSRPTRSSRRTGGPAALIATEGFRDVLEIARQIRHDLYDLRTTKPVPLVPRPWALEVRERLLLRRLGRSSRSTRSRCARSPAGSGTAASRSVAVCLLHAYVNPVHERARRRDPGERAPRHLDLALERDRARDPRVPAGQHDRRQRLCRTGRRGATSHAIEAGLRGARRATPACG